MHLAGRPGATTWLPHGARRHCLRLFELSRLHEVWDRSLAGHGMAEWALYCRPTPVMAAIESGVQRPEMIPSEDLG